MRPLIILGIYALVPFIICWLYKQLKIKKTIAITHILVAIIVLFIPSLVLKIDNWLDPPDMEESMCGTPTVMLNFVNIILMVPITQGLVFLFNKQLKNKYSSGKQENKMDL